MKYYNVKLKHPGSLSEKTVKVAATSETNARYEAEKQYPGWNVVDIRP